jgi:acyl carrier protein
MRILLTGGGAGTEAIWRICHGRYELYFADAGLIPILPDVPDQRRIAILVAKWLLEMDYKSKIIRLLSEVLDVEDSVINEDLGIGDIPEWDSLAQLNIVTGLENEFNININVEEVLDLEYVDDIFDLVNEKTKNK